MFRNRLFFIVILCLLSTASLLAQRNRIAKTVDNRQRVFLAGNVHPRTRNATDQGPVDASLSLPHVTMVLKQSDSQKAALEQLLAEQQDPSSPNYHHWLTPEEYADRFGVSRDDLDKIVAWLKDQNLSIVSVARARNWVAFSGTAGEVANAFGTRIHHYLVDGRVHFANATEPSIPAALAEVVGGVHGLTDFRLRPSKRSAQPLQPNYNSSKGNHYLAPDDVAVIYNVQPLYDAGIDGAGQQLVVVGQTQIKLADLQQFRSFFNLAGSDPKIVLVPDTTDPGIVSDDMSEADLDLEWAGAVARNATITYVYSDDVLTSVKYAIDQNIAPVLSMSYGLCEAETPASQARAMQSWARQANAQGTTWITASGDSGAVDCASGSSRVAAGLSVDLPAGLPEVTGVGGTTFDEGSGTYWNTSNNGNKASVLSYIPETSWNDGAADGSPSASGGGASTFFAKPSWQTGTGVPNDGARDVPDIALSGSANHDGYLVYTGGTLQVFGGTSVGAPVFAGIAGLLNQYLVANGFQASAGLGNMNPRIYSLAQATPSAFHDVTTGDNMVSPCPQRSRNCTLNQIGYSAGVGYDQVTGLGSVDAHNLVLAWHTNAAAARASAAMDLTADAGSILPSGRSTLTATVKGSNGTTPTGSVVFSLGSTLLGAATLTGSGGVASATLTVSGAQLTVGASTITAQYSGDGFFNSATASVTIALTVTPSGPPSISGLANGASFQRAYAPGMILTVFGSQLAPTAVSASGVPLPAQLVGVSATINGVAAPLYYVSPGQLNIQIPYETATNSTVLLTVRNNGQIASANFRVAAAAPGIFADQNGAPVPNTTAVRGQVITMYVTGDGAVSPSLATGSAPAAGTAVASLPKPTQPVVVTVGGVPASIPFIGIPSGLAGVTQINYQVPAQIALGTQSVVVTVGGVSSAPVNLKVTQ